MEKAAETILELLKILISWPVVALGIFLLLVGLIRGLIKSWEGRGAEISTPIGAIKIVSSEKIGEIAPQKAKESPQQAIEELLQRQKEPPKGVVQVFVGRNTISHGSGFVVISTGLAISDVNVIGDSQEVFVKFSGEEAVKSAKVLARSPGTLLALLQLPETDGEYPTLKLASAVAIGERIYKVSTRSGMSDGTVYSKQR